MRKRSAKRDQRDYEIGFGRPPKATRFKPGESGNPRGRPKGSRPVGAVLQEVLRQRIPVTENGRTRRLPALEVMLRRLANEAMRSEPSAVKLMLSLVDRYAEAPEATLSVDEVLAEDQAIIARYLSSTPANQTISVSRKRRKRDAD
jgi:hypothetical protein